ncbi:MAG: phosphoribosyltransferase [Halanaeroarchaeum sp.]
MFQDRESAGERLAAALRDHDVAVDVVLGIPRGGLPAARAVADEFDVPIDVVAAKKLGAPNNPELAIGAAAADGSVWLNGDLIDRIGVSERYVETEREKAASVAAEKEETYREGRDAPDLNGAAVAIVDDGFATGATIRAAIRAVANAGAARIVVGVPVGPSDTAAELEDEADEVIVVEEPAGFGAIGAHYRDFSQVSDEEAMTYLRR